MSDSRRIPTAVSSECLSTERRRGRGAALAVVGIEGFKGFLNFECKRIPIGKVLELTGGKVVLLATVVLRGKLDLIALVWCVSYLVVVVCVCVCGGGGERGRGVRRAGPGYLRV